VPFLLVRIDDESRDDEDEGVHTRVVAGGSGNVGAVSLVVVVLVAAFACPPPMRAQHVAALRTAIDRASLELGAKNGENAAGTGAGAGAGAGAGEGVSARVSVLPRAYASHLLPLAPAPTDGFDTRARAIAREHERAHMPLRARPFAEQQAAEEGASCADPCAPLAFCGGVRVAPLYLRALLRQHVWSGSVELKPDFRGGAASATLAVSAALCGRRSKGDAPFSLVAASVGVAGDAPSLAAQFARAVHCAVGVAGAEEPFPGRIFARVDEVVAGAGAAAVAGGGPAVAGASAQPAAPRCAGYLRLQQQQVTVWPAVGQSPASLRIFWRVESCAARGEGRAANDASVTGSSCESADREAVDAAVGAL
jgi:hypothetical protein